MMIWIHGWIEKMHILFRSIINIIGWELLGNTEILTVMKNKIKKTIFEWINLREYLANIINQLQYKLYREKFSRFSWPFEISHVFIKYKVSENSNTAIFQNYSLFFPNNNIMNYYEIWIEQLDNLKKLSYMTLIYGPNQDIELLVLSNGIQI